MPRPELTKVAVELGLPPAHVFGVATFYAHFSLEPRGRHVLRVCDGTACHVKGSSPLLEALRRHLGLAADQRTTTDRLFTLETVSCLGACGLAPVLVIDDAVHGEVSEARAAALVDELRATAAASADNGEAQP